MNKIIIYNNINNPTATLFAESACRELLSQGIICFVKASSYSQFEQPLDSEKLIIIDDDLVVNDADCIISFGGDGTMLSAVKQYYAEEIPIMGFNVGKLGFLAEFATNKLFDGINNLLTRNYKTIIRFAISCEYKENKGIALNDFVIGKTNQSKMVLIKASANSQFIGDYRADGVIISTPTGSTAYSLACGGPVLSPNANVMCITPISPHSLTLRPLVIPNDMQISFQVFSPNGQANLFADGNNIAEIDSEDIVNFSTANKHIKIIVPTESNYFSVLREKLLWAEHY